MATREDIQKWIINAQHRYTTYKATVDECDAKIDRLKPVYKTLGEIKSDILEERNTTASIIETKGTWTGEKHTTFCNDGDTLDSACSQYYDTLDAAQDAVNVKIGELTQKKQELIPLIGKLISQITEWKVEFQNAIN